MMFTRVLTKFNSKSDKQMLMYIYMCIDSNSYL